MRLYYNPISVTSRVLWLFCLEAGVADHVQRVEVNVIRGDQYKEEFLKLNPNHTVPVLQDDDGHTLVESTSILRFLALKFKTAVGTHWYPTYNIQRQARVDQLLTWAAVHLAPVCAAFVQATFHSLLHAAVQHSGDYRAAESEESAQLHEVLSELDNVWLARDTENASEGDIPFQVKIKVSIAELYIVTHLGMIHDLGVDLSQYKVVSRWRRRVLGSLLHWDKVHAEFERVIARIRGRQGPNRRGGGRW